MSSAREPNQSGKPPSSIHIFLGIHRHAPIIIPTSVRLRFLLGTGQKGIKQAADINKFSSLSIVLWQAIDSISMGQIFVKKGFKGVLMQDRVIIQQENELSAGFVDHPVVADAESDIVLAFDQINLGVFVFEESYGIIR